jgi:Zn-dependent M16 (insulinase) family peptidase
MDPGEKGFVSLQRKLHGVTDAARQMRRESLLSADVQSLGRVAQGLRESSERGFTAVIANQQSLADASAQMPELARRVIDLPE